MHDTGQTGRGLAERTADKEEYANTDGKHPRLHRHHPLIDFLARMRLVGRLTKPGMGNQARLRATAGEFQKFEIADFRFGDSENLNSKFSEFPNLKSTLVELSKFPRRRSSKRYWFCLV